MRKVLNAAFFNRPVLEVTPDLVGKFLVREIDGVQESHMITEVEAYDGEQDLACHASKGRTLRTEVMYGKPGIWYVYLIYGMYDMLNIVTGEEGYPSAVLIRGVESISGPGRLTKRLSVDRSFNAMLAIPATRLWIEDRGVKISSDDIEITPRIGVAYAKEWALKPYRFVLKEKKESK